MGTNRRRHDRFDAIIPVRVTQGKAQYDAATVDVSVSGFSAVLDRPVPLRQLMKFDIALPGDGAPLRAMGMAVRVSQAPGGGGSKHRVGVQLFGMDRVVAERWSRFIHHHKHEPQPTPPFPSAAEDPPEEESTEIRPEIRLRPASAEQLRATIDGLGGTTLRIRTELYLEPGTPVRVVLVHPDDEREIGLDAIVAPSPAGPTLALRILDLETSRARLAVFVDEPAPDERSVSIDIAWEDVERTTKDLPDDELAPHLALSKPSLEVPLPNARRPRR
jgi:hypothetical protein